MAAELAASERLNYLSKKQRAVSSKHSRLIYNATNGNSFFAGGITTIQIPGSQAATYMDFQNSYLRFTVKNQDTVDVSLGSAYDLIERLEILADGQTLSNIANYGTAVAQYFRMEVGNAWRSRVGRILTGASYDENEILQVDTISASDEKTYCLPLVLTPLFSVNKYIPLVGRSNLQIRITWAECLKAFVGDAGLVNTDIKYSPVDFIAQTVRLSNDANAMVMANTGGRFELITSDIRTAEGKHTPNTNKTIALNCGFSFSSLDRVSFAFYQQNESNTAYSCQSSTAGGVIDYALAINGEEYPRKRIKVSSTNISEAVAELCVGHRSLADFNHHSNLVPGDYYVTTYNGSDGEIGSFVAMIDTESMQPHTGDSLYSGVSTIGSVVQLVANVDPNETDSTTSRLLVFAQYTMALVLDMQGTQTWTVSI